MHGYRASANTSACPSDSGPYFAEYGGDAVLVSVESDGPDCPHAGEETTSRVDNQVVWMSMVIN